MAVKLPDWTDLGATPQVQGSMPVAGYDPSALARAGEAVGKSIGAVGESVADFAMERSRYEYHQAHADLVTNTINQYDQLVTDTDYATMPKRYGDQHEKNRQAAAEAISDPNMRQRFLTDTQDQTAQFNSNIYKHSYKLAGDARAAYRTNYADTIIKKVPDLPSEVERRNALDAYNGLVDGDGALTPEQRVAEKKKVAEHYATTSALADMQKDPLTARKALDNPDPKSLYAIIPLETRLRLRDHARTLVGTQAGEAAVSAASNGAGVPMVPSSSGGFQPVVNVEPAKTGLVTINAAGKSLTVHSSVAPQFKGFIEDLAAAGAPIHDIGSFNPRNIAGTNTPSQHAFGTAIDINQNARNEVSPDFAAWAKEHPQELRDALDKWGIVSGGDWKNNPDFGHFEVKGAAQGGPSGGKVIPAMVGSPATAASLKAAAYQHVIDNADLTPQERHAALTYISQSMTAADIAAETTQRQQKEQSDATLGSYLDRIAKGDFGADGSIAREALGDTRLLPAARESLARFAKEASGDRGQLVDYGPGWLDAKKAVLARAGTPGHIADPAEIMERALPGGDLTPAGARDLIQTMQLAHKSPDEYGLQQTKTSLQNYAKGQLSFEADTGPIKIRDPKGEAIFASQFIPKFNAAYGKWVGEGKDPWAFLTREKTDELLKGMRDKRQMAADRMTATGEAVPEDNTPPPPAPKGANAEAWGKLMANRPLTPQGTRFPAADWATAINKLLADPSPEKMKAFNESKFGAWGYHAEDIVGRLKPEKTITDLVK